MASLLDSLYSLAQRNGVVDKVLAESIKVVYATAVSKWTAVDATTSVKGIVKLNDATNSTSTTEAATANAVKITYDLANSKWTVVNGSTSVKGIVQLSTAVNSTSTALAATASAVKSAYDLAASKWSAVDASTTVKGIVQLNSAVNSTSVTQAATPSAVKTTYDLANSKWSEVDATTSNKGIVQIGTNISVSNGTISVATGSTSVKGVVQLNDTINSTSTALAATANAVKTVYDFAASKWTAVDGTTTVKGILKLNTAINSTSTTEAATPSAVKSAYDLANSKWNAVDASETVKGIVQIGSGLSVADGIISVPTFVKSGSTAAAGLVPSPDTTVGTTRFICEDGTWKEPSDINVTNTLNTTTKAYLTGTTSDTTNTGTQVFDTGVYLDTVAGRLVADTIIQNNAFATTVALSANAIDVSTGSVFTKTISAATTFTFSGVPANKAATFSLVLINGGVATVTWPSNVYWANGVAPDLTRSGRDLLTFCTTDGGASWYGIASIISAEIPS